MRRIHTINIQTDDDGTASGDGGDSAAVGSLASTSSSTPATGDRTVQEPCKTTIIAAEASAKKLREHRVRGFIRFEESFFGLFCGLKPCNQEGQQNINTTSTSLSEVIKRPQEDFFDAWNLGNLVQICVDDFESKPGDGNVNKDSLTRLKETLGDVRLMHNGRATSLFVCLMGDIVSQLNHFHKEGVTHLDLQPQNVLIIKGTERLYAKLSDSMGTSEHSDHHSSGCNTWYLSRLGFLLFFCITGQNIFGDNGKLDLFWLEELAEAHHLISLLLSSNPDELRPKEIPEMLSHPLMWNSVMILEFLRDTSDHVKAGCPRCSTALEEIRLEDIGAKWKGKLVKRWNKTINKGLIKYMLGFVKYYNFENVQGLLRFIRNMYGHFIEVQKNNKGRMKGVTEKKDLDNYFTSRFPKLVIEVYKVVGKNCKDEECFKQYFKSSL